MQKWEYLTLNSNWNHVGGGRRIPPEEFTKLGREGWELVSVVGYCHGQDEFGNALNFIRDYFFKRPLL